MPESNAELAALIAQMQHEIRLPKDRLVKVEAAGSAGIALRDRERRLRVTIETYKDAGAAIAFRDIDADPRGERLSMAGGDIDGGTIRSIARKTPQ